MAARHGLFVAATAGGVTAPQDARLALAGLLSAKAGPLGDGPGIMWGPGGPCQVTGSTSGPNMQYNLAAGDLVTQRASAATDGLYLWANDGTVLVSSGTPAPSSGSRYDLIWAKHANQLDGQADANSDPLFGVAVGTASGSPVRPTGSVPAGALVVAEALVGTNIANASLATITMVAPYKVARGAPIPVRSQAERDALAMVDGLRVWRLDTNLEEWCDGSAWRGVTPGRIGAAISLTDSWVTDATRTHSGTWGALDQQGGAWLGAVSSNTTPLTVPAGTDGTYAITLRMAWTTATTNVGYIQLQTAGTPLFAGLPTAYTQPFPTGATSVTLALPALPLKAGQTLNVLSHFETGANTKSLAGMLAMYRVSL